MIANLRRSSNSFKPRADGELLGTLNSLPTAVSVSWLIDTGSDVPLVRYTLAQSFDWVPDALGQYGYGTTGGPAFAIASDPIVRVFSDAGAPFDYQGWIGVKPNDEGSDIVGVDALAAWGAELIWDAGSGVGCIRGI